MPTAKKPDKSPYVIRNNTPKDTQNACLLAIVDTRINKVIGAVSANLNYDDPTELEVDAHSNATGYTTESIDEFLKKYDRTVREELFILGLEWGVSKGATKIQTHNLEINDQKLFFMGVNYGWFNMEGDIKILPMSLKLPLEKK